MTFKRNKRGLRNRENHGFFTVSKSSFPLSFLLWAIRKLMRNCMLIVLHFRSFQITAPEGSGTFWHEVAPAKPVTES